MIGKHLAQYRILEKIGEGGMGEVYRAQDENLGREVALKVLPPDFAADEDRRNRFVREARMAAAVNHPNIATIHGIDQVDGRLFISMELVKGRPLGKVIDGRPLPVERALDIAVQIAGGLARAHANGIVHRDLKPDNVLLDEHGHVKVLDFGLAKPYETREADTDSDALPTLSAELTQDGRILGTVAYMSPEQARGLPLDFRSDLFSFGVLLYEMVTGRKPFEGPTITDTLTAILRDRQPPIAKFNPEVPAEFERILGRCLEKEAENRYGDTQTLVDELTVLKRATDSQSVSLPRVTLSGELPWSGRASRWWTLAAVAAVAVVVGLSIGVPRVFRDRDSSEQIATLENSLAVLPFEHLQDSEDASRFGQIVQELIITDLSESAGFRVFSSQRLFDIQKQLGRDRKTTIDRDLATEVARRAGASTMLTGTLSRLGETWIVTAQLVDVSDGTVIKSERIDGSDLYAMVDELTPLVRNDVGLAQAASLAGEDVDVRERTTASIEAYQAYLDGVDSLNALRFGEAVASLEKAVEIDPTFGRAQYKLAIARWWQQDLGDPVDHTESGPVSALEALLASGVKLSQKDRLLAEASLALVERRFAEAVPLYEKLVDLYPDEKEAWYGLGEARFHSAGGPNDEEAKNAFESAIALDPTFRLAYFHVVDYYTRMGRFDEGVTLVRALLDQDPDNPMWHMEWAVLHAARGSGENVEKVVDDCLSAVDHPKHGLKLLIQVAGVFGKRGQHTEVERYLLKALETPEGQRDAMVLSEMGWVMVRTGRPDEAETWFRKALDASEGKSAAAHRGLIRVALDRSDGETARRRLEAMEKVQPEGYMTGVARLETLVHTGKVVEAERLIDRLVEEAKSDSTWMEVLGAGFGAFLNAGEFDRAERLARRSQELVNSDSDPYGPLRVGWALLGQQKVEEAEEQFLLARERAPQEGEAAWALAAIRLMRDDPGGAETILRESMASTPGTLPQATLMAYVLAAQERWTEAESQARRAVAWAPSARSLSTLAWVLVAGDIDVDGGMKLAERARAIPNACTEDGSRLPFLAPPEHALGLAYLKRGDYERAAALLKETIRDHPERALAQDHLRQAESLLVSKVES